MSVFREPKPCAQSGVSFEGRGLARDLLAIARRTNKGSMNDRDRTRFASEEALADERPSVAGEVSGLLPSAAQATPVTEVMVRAIVCVDPDMGVPALMRLFLERGISGAPVVDARGKAIGVVSKTDIVRALYEDPDAAHESRLEGHEPSANPDARGSSEPHAGPRVRDLMTPLTIFVGDNASIARAAAMMAYERIHRLLVIDPAGNVVGLLSAMDVLRWLARHDGYAIP
jgi:CBS domain-containing protein